MAASGMEHWKVTMLGDGGVGKTALAVQFTQKQFIETYDPTIEDSYRKQVFVDGKMSFLEIIDTAGQEDYSTLREQWIREGQGFILVYSVTNQTSFQNIDRFRKTMISLHAELPVFLIIGNKADDPYRREVSAEQGLTYARRHNCEFFEASAKNGQNVERLFGEVVRQLRATARSAPQPLTPNSMTSTNGRSTRTSNSGYSGTGTATPLTVPSSGSLAHAGSRSGSRNPLAALADSANAGGNAFAYNPHMQPSPARPGPSAVPGKPGSGGSSPGIGPHSSGGARGRGSGRGSNGRLDGTQIGSNDLRVLVGSSAGGGGAGPGAQSRPQISTGVSARSNGSGSGAAGGPARGLNGAGAGASGGGGGNGSGRSKPPKRGKEKDKDKDKGGCVIM